MEHRAIPMESLLPLLQLQMDNGTKAPLCVTGTSMLPMLTPQRDTVYLEKCTQALKSGDVILYRRATGEFILHRIISAKEPLVCCGDNQWRSERVARDQVIARVTEFKRNHIHRSIDYGWYRVYVFFWVNFYCLRRSYIRIRRWTARLFRKRNK